MRKSIVKIALILSIACSVAFGQNAKPKFVVSVSGELDVNSSDALADIINHAVIKSQRYSVLPNDRQFRETLKNEWKKGNVSDDRVIALAKSAGADYLCFAKITSLLGSNQVAVQLVNLSSEPMEYSNMGIARGRLNDLDYFATKIEEAVDDMLGIKRVKAEPEKSAQEAVKPANEVVTFGKTEPKTEPAIKGTMVPGATLAGKLAWLNRNAESHSTYIVEVSADENIATYTFEYQNAINITVVLRGVGGNRTIRLSSHGAMFIVKQNVTLVLDNNITLMGHKGNTSCLVENYGELKMDAGATITGNGDCGVYVGGQKGNFTMNGGIISNNTSSGVYIGQGNFTMNDGIISGNTSSRGGGVFVAHFCAFNMHGGTITGNTAKEYGGGVYLAEYYNFTKTGGTITGYKNDQSNGNVVKDQDGTITRRGHAVANYNASRRKETTVGPEMKLSCKGNDCTGAWDE